LILSSCLIGRKGWILTFLKPIKGTVSRDFWPLVFFHQSTPPRALTHRLKPYRIWLRIHRDNRFKNCKNRFQRCQWHRWNWKWSLEFPNFFLLIVLI
jgi:hypothetical protein